MTIPPSSSTASTGEQAVTADDRRDDRGGELTSWRSGEAKEAILEFVRSVSEPGEAFVPQPERIATFDNDGTLWCEKPLYPQADFLFRRWREMAEQDPAKRNQQPYKAIVEGDEAWLAGLTGHLPELIRGVTEAYEGITTSAFEDAVGEFFATATHPTLGVPYTQVGYRPMCELIALLKSHGFTVYICSAGGRDFVRPVAEQMYGVSRECVIGSATTLEYREGRVYRAGAVEQPIDDGPGKPVHIWSRTGRAPLLAGGNADGDTAMLETARFAMLIHHDDAEREFAYDAGAEHALAEATKRGWLIVSMQHDFARIF
jgi:phosphoserine phosphatase